MYDWFWAWNAICIITSFMWPSIYNRSYCSYLRLNLAILLRKESALYDNSCKKSSKIFKRNSKIHLRHKGLIHKQKNKSRALETFSLLLIFCTSNLRSLRSVKICLAKNCIAILSCATYFLSNRKFGELSY